MIIHNIEECNQWVHYREWYPLSNKVFLFEPKIDDKLFTSEHIVDLPRKSFQHDQDRVVNNINIISDNLTTLKKMMNNLHIFFCPKPAVDTANACANGDMICYFSRSTQIPWCMTDYITGHELGHVIQYNRCNHRRGEKFREYLEVRKAEKGICEVYDHYDEEKEENVYRQEEDFLYLYGTPEQQEKYRIWDNNPQEWFAEDFRYLFGVDQGEKYWGLSIDKPDEKVKEFILSL